MEQNLIALSFDDGPNDTVTAETLDRLEKYGVRASFFLIGQNITPRTASYAERALSLGCELENHSLTHSNMTEQDTDVILDEISTTQELIHKISGRYPEFFRPPFIEYDQRLFDLIDLTFICGGGCNDWDPQVSTEERYTKALAQCRNGEILLLHDNEFNTKTYPMLDMLIPELLEKDFEFVTVSELFRRLNIKPQRNMIYSNVFDSKPAKTTA